MNRLVVSIAEACLPARSAWLYRVGRRLCQRYLGEGDDDMERNGELRTARAVLASVPGDVMDIGANLGDWTQAALPHSPGTAFHLFEPVLATYRSLAAKPWPERVRVNRAAVGDREGTVSLMVCPGASRSNSLYRRSGVGVMAAEEEVAECITLDAYAERHAIERIALAKVDVEGHELAVFRGARRLLAQERIGAIQFEYGGTYIDARVLLKDVFEFLAEVGPRYRLFKLHSRGLLPAPEYRQSFENFQYANWLVARDDLAQGALAPLLLR